jgi:transcriptional regulator with XRE-family HTH domain
MGQEIRGIPQDPALTPAPPGPADPGGSIGRYLARQRQLRGLSQQDLAALTKIPLRSIERLEAGAFDRQADGFARGFVRTVAGALGLDVEEAVMRLLGEPEVQEDERAPARLALRRGAVLSALFLGVAAVGLSLWLLWSGSRRDTARGVGDEVVYRRDVVRELAAELRGAAGGGDAPGAAASAGDAAGGGGAAVAGGEPLDSRRAADPH